MGRNDPYIDLGTDARTAPTSRMWEAMQAVALNATPFKGQEAVEALLARACELTGQAAALLLPSCTMANLIAMMAHTDRGDQVILEESSHIAWSEGWGMASIAGIYPKLLKGRRGAIDLEEILSAVEASVFSHRPRTKLLCLENTHNAGGGAVLPQDYTAEVCAAMKEREIYVHLDGARIVNAAVALNLPVRQITEMYDSVTINLNKGLCALEGALLCGSAAMIRKASQLARALGGDSQHKAEIIAAAGLIGLNEMVDAIVEDHRRAYLFASAVQRIPGIGVELQRVQTNIVMVDVSGTGLAAGEVLQRLKIRGVASYLYNDAVLRFVFHREINDDDALRASCLLKEAVG